MNKAQVNGMRGQSRTWSSTIVPTEFWTDCVANAVTIYNPHLIVGYYHIWGMPLFMNLDFNSDFPLIGWETVFPNTTSLPFDSMDYASNYAYTPFSTLTQVKQGGGALPQPPSPTAPITLSNYDYTIDERFFYWYKTINEGMSNARTGLQTPGNPFLKTTTSHDEVGNQAVTSINNNFSSFSAFNFIDMLDESYCDISKYFVYNQTTTWGGVIRTLDAGIYGQWQSNLETGNFLVQIMYLDRGHGFEFERTLVP